MRGPILRSMALPAAVLLLAAAPVAAQEAAIPKTVRIVAASAGGTGPDFIARLIAPKLGEGLRVSAIVENRPSANGVATTAYVAKSAPDGSVMMMGNAGTHAINAALYKKLEYDPVADFAPITEVASIPLALVVHPSVPAKNVKELVTLARKMPGKLNIAIAGAAGELMGNALKLQAKIDMLNIPYKGGNLAAIAVMSGEADMVFTSYVVIASHVESGRLRVLGVSSAERMPQLAKVPTIAEQGMPGYEHEQWYALFAPAKTPASVVQALHKEVTRIVHLPDVNEKLLATGHRVVAGTPQQLSDKVKREIDKTRKIMRESEMAQL